jgi:hypothetical protein
VFYREPMGLWRSGVAFCAAACLLGPAVANAGTVHVSGTGWARVNATSANVWSVNVPSGTVQFTGPAVTSMYCLSGAAPATCVKKVKGTKSKWRIVAPTGFLAQGSQFTATIFSTSVFDLNMQGVGRLAVSGAGTVTIRHSSKAYSGFSIFAIR